MRAGRPWKCTFSPAIRIHRASASFSGNRSRIGRVGGGDVAGSPDSAAHRNGPLPSQNSGRM